MLSELITKCRSYRRFHQNEPISREELLNLVDLARLSSCGANAQALKYMIFNSEEDNEKIFRTIGWAAALPDWNGPEEGEKPSAYILVLCDLSLGKNKQTDYGIAAQSMLLGAVEKGYGGCMIGNFKRSELAEALKIDREAYSLDLILALGKPKEEVVIVPVKEDGSVTYYRDDSQVHYVPKRSLEEVCLNK